MSEKIYEAILKLSYTLMMETGDGHFDLTLPRDVYFRLLHDFGLKSLRFSEAVVAANDESFLLFGADDYLKISASEKISSGPEITKK